MPTPRVAISFFFCFNSSHTDFVILKITYIVHHYKSYWLHWFVGHNTIAQEGHLLDKRRASIRLFTVSGAVMTVFCRRGCISIASQTVDKGVNCVTIIICSKKISAQNVTWQLRALSNMCSFLTKRIANWTSTSSPGLFPQKMVFRGKSPGDEVDWTWSYDRSVLNP